MMKWLTRIAGFIFVAENMPNVIDRLLEVAEGVWAIVSGVSVLVTRQVREFVDIMIIVLGVMALAIIVGFIFRWETVIVSAGVIASLTILVAWRISSTIVRLAPNAAKILGKKVVSDAADDLADSLKRLLHPFLVASMIMAFIATIVAIKGVGYFTLKDVVLWAGLLTFIGIFTIWLDSKVKISGYVMITVILYFLLGSYFWPIQVGGVLRWIDAKTTGKSISLTQEALREGLVFVPKGTHLFVERGWELVSAGKTPVDARAKVVGQKVDNTTKEVIYKIVLPRSDGGYLTNSKPYWVEDRMVKQIIATGDTYRQAQGPVEYGEEGDYALDVSHGVSDWVMVKEGFVYSLSGDGEVQPFYTGGHVPFWQAESLPKPGETFRVHTTNGQNVVLRVRVKGA